MPGRHLKYLFLALTLAAIAPAFAASDQDPCATKGDMKSALWRSSCDAAIATAADDKERASLLFGRAYAAVEDYRYEDALKDLTAALGLVPETVAYLRERAYVNVELSNFAEAIADLDRASVLSPDDPLIYRERAYARHFHGDLPGSYEDRVREFELTPDSASALLSRSDAEMWLGRFDDARADAKRARKMARSSGDDKAEKRADEAQATIGLWRFATRGGDPAKLCKHQDLADKEVARKLIGDCTKAFLEAKTGKSKADFLTARSTAWLVAGESQDSATEDMQMARAFDPGNVNRHINLGYSYLVSNHSWAANREFEKAVAIEREPYALAGRAAARMNLGDLEGAKSDALASNELEPNEAATAVLAGLAYLRGDRDEARELYLLIYERGSRADDLIERLHDLDVDDPEAAIKK